MGTVCEQLFILIKLYKVALQIKTRMHTALWRVGIECPYKKFKQSKFVLKHTCIHVQLLWKSRNIKFLTVLMP